MRYSRFTPPFAILAAVAALFVLNSASAAPDRSDTGPLSLNEYAARRIARIAVIDNRQVANPGPADFEITSLLIGVSQRFEPNDPALIRMRLDAAITGGDQDTTIAQTRALIKLTPDDTVAQLRLISHRINQEQTVEDRIDLVEKFLGPTGDRIPAEIRSRLALDAALWHRDEGDDEAFVRYLVMATSLDATNKNAAYVAANYFVALIDDPAGRLELLVNLLLADPLDPQTHLAIAAELATNGAFEQALRFQRIALSLAATSPDYDASHILQGELMLVWHVEGPDAVVAILNDRLVRSRDEIARELRAAEAAGQVVIDPPDPGDQNLSFGDERVRLLAASAVGDAATTGAAATAIRISIPQYMERLVEQGLDAEATDRNRQVLETEFTLTRLWIGHDVPGAIEDANRLVQEIESRDGEGDAVRLLKAFVAVRSDEPELVLELLSQIEQHTIFNDIVRALAAASNGDVDRVRVLLSELATNHPLNPVGAWAMTKLKGADPAAQPFGQIAFDLTTIAKGVPAWLDQMVTRPNSFMSLSVEAIDTAPRALARGGLRVRIKNTSSIPLGVGPDRPINSNLLFAPNVVIDLASELHVRSEVVDGARRLRLGPYEELVFDVWPSFWADSALVDLACSHTTRTRTRVIQGFVTSTSVGYQPGPICLDADAPAVRHTPLAESVLGFDKLLEHLASGPEETLPATLAVLTGWLVVPTTGQKPLAAEQVKQFADAVAARYPTLSPVGKSLMLSVMPTSIRVEQMKPLDDIALEESDSLAMPMVMMTRATDPNHAIFDRAAASGDELVVRLGALLKARLHAGEYAFSTQGAPGSDG